MALASEDRKGFYWEDGRARRQEARLNSVSPAQGFGLHLQEERGALRTRDRVPSFRRHGDPGPRRQGIAAFQAGRCVVRGAFRPRHVKRLFRGAAFL